IIDDFEEMAIIGGTHRNSVKLLAIVVLGFCCSLVFGGHGPRTDPSEVNALGSIRGSLIDPYRNLANWDKGDPCTSNWTGLICYNTTLQDGYFHVRQILLLNRNLSGILSPALGNLSYLEIMDFMWNDINGTIPKEIGNITTLQL
ncbi:hypothetical protein M569_04915, partial [Genlisea aurea]